MEAVVVMRRGFAARPRTRRDPSASTSTTKARNRSYSTPQTRFLHPRARNKTPSPESKPIIPSVSPSSSSSSSSSSSLPEVHVETRDSYLQTTTNQPSKTVHVKFVLQKACLFGQKFLIVGDNPIFGLWDPSKAVPLEWSHGHIWTTELDLPVGEPIQFKFILQCTSGEIAWQPGPDRVLHTWETDKTIVILEDWEKEEDRKIIEDEPSAILTDKVITEENKSDPDRVLQTWETDKTIVILEDWEEEEDRKIIEDKPSAILTDKVITEENKSSISGRAVIDKAQDGMSGKSLTQSMTNEKKLTSSEDDLVLVPGLVRTPASTTATAIQKELSNGMVADVSTPSNGPDDCSSPQLSGQQEESELPSGNLIEDHIMTASKSSHDVDSKETLNKKDDALSEEDSEAKSPPAIGVVRNDILWGRETLQQLLLNLGFPLRLINDDTA